MERNDYLIKKSTYKILYFCILLMLSKGFTRILSKILIGNLLGTDFIAVENLGSVVVNLVMLPGCILQLAGATLLGNLLGKKQREKACEVFTGCLFIGLALSAVMMLSSLFAKEIAVMIAGDSEIVPSLTKYIRAVLLNAPLYNISIMMLSFMIMDNNAKLSTIYTYTSSLIRVVLQFVFLKYLNCGIEYVEISYGLGTLAAMGIYIIYARSDTRMLSIKNPTHRLKDCLKTICEQGKPELVDMLGWAISVAVIESYIVRVSGEEALVLSAVTATITNFSVLLLGGIKKAIPSLFGVMYSEKDYYGLEKTGKRISRVFALIMGVMAVVLLFFPARYLRVFGFTSDEISPVYYVVVRINVILCAVRFIHDFMNDYYQSINQKRLAYELSIYRNIVFDVPTAVVFSLICLKMGTEFYYGIIAAQIVSIGLSLLIVFLHLIKNRQSIFFIPHDEETMMFNFSVSTDVNNIVPIYDEVKRFCEGCGLSARCFNRIALIIEEMIVVVSRENEGKKYGLSYIDIKITVSEEELIVNIRSDGKTLDPTAYVEKSETDLSNLAFLRKVCSHTKYVRTLDLNNTSFILDRKMLEA